MSYDVSIGGENFNYTFNVSHLFYDHIPDAGKGGGLKELDGVTGRQGATILRDAFEAISRTRHDLWVKDAIGEPAFDAKYSAKNGWGSALGGVCFLAEILGACAANPRRRIHVGM